MESIDIQNFTTDEIHYLKSRDLDPDKIPVVDENYIETYKTYTLKTVDDSEDEFSIDDLKEIYMDACDDYGEGGKFIFVSHYDSTYVDINYQVLQYETEYEHEQRISYENSCRDLYIMKINSAIKAYRQRPVADKHEQMLNILSGLSKEEALNLISEIYD